MSEPVWNHGEVFWQEGGEDLPEPAILIHVDNGGAMILQQENRYITLTRTAANVKALNRAISEVFKRSEK